MQTPRTGDLQENEERCRDVGARAQDGERDEITELFTNIKDKYRGVIELRAGGVRECKEQLGERDPPSLAVEILAPLLAASLAGVTARIAARLVENMVGPMKTVIENMLKDGQKAAVQGRVDQVLRAGRNDRIAFFGAQEAGLSILNTSVQTMLNQRQRIVLGELNNITPDCRNEQMTAMRTSLQSIASSLEAATEEPKTMQYRESLSAWMSSLAQSRLGSQSDQAPPEGERAGTDMRRSLETGILGAPTGVAGVVYVNLICVNVPFRGWRMEDFSRVQDVELRGVSRAARNAGQMQGMTLGQLNAPIIVERGSNNLRFGRDENGRFWTQPGSARALTTATGARTPEDGARMIFDQFIAPIPFSRVQNSAVL